MSHKVSYKCIRRTQYIPRFGGVLQECGKIVEVSDCEELVGGYSQERMGGGRLLRVSDSYEMI